MCESVYVDEISRLRIIAYNAEFQKVSKSPFGVHDQIGMLNLMDADSRQLIMGRVDPSRMFDLSVDHFVGMPAYPAGGAQPYQIWMTHTPQGSVVDRGGAVTTPVTGTGDAISMYNHCGTHIDTLNHFGYCGRIFNDFNTQDHLGSRGWTRCGAEQHPPMLARGVLLDVAALHGVDTLEPNYAIGPDDLKSCCRRQGVEIRPGDVVLVRTGQMRLWPNASFAVKCPGINLEAAEYLAHQGAIMIGADNLALEIMIPDKPESFFAVHAFLLAQAGIPILENAYLEELAAEKVFEFAFFGACIKLRGATGAPMRPIAMRLS